MIATRLALLDQPEFQDPTRVKQLFGAIEAKASLLRVLEKMIDAQNVRVVFGEELEEPELDRLALVAAPYGAQRFAARDARRDRSAPDGLPARRRAGSLPRKPRDGATSAVSEQGKRPDREGWEGFAEEASEGNLGPSSELEEAMREAEQVARRARGRASPPAGGSRWLRRRGGACRRSSRS